MAGPLEGLVVVDATWGMPGAVASMMFADYGATVVKICRPDAPEVAPLLERILDRGKTRLRVDPNDTGDRVQLDAVLERADVLFQSRPAMSAPSLIGADADLEARYPHLVNTVITGHGEGGPFADVPGYDVLVAARMGLLAEQRGHRDAPIFMGHASINYVTGFLATVGALAALRARRLSGRGQTVDTSMLDGALAVSTMNWWWNEHGISHLARSGKDKGFGHNRLITDLFRCADGEYLMMHTGGRDGTFGRTMEVLGLGHHIKPVEGLEMATPLDDAEYHAARHLVPEVFLTRNRDEWLKELQSRDIAALPVLHPQEVFDDDQVRFAGVEVALPDPEYGTLRQVGPVVRFAGADHPAVSPAGELSAGPAAVRSLVERAPPVSLTTDSGAPVYPLAGIRILDFSGFFATAFGARLLCDLGADVIKVEPTTGDQMRPLADLYEGANRGKRNLALDLGAPEGRAVIARLVATTDVVMHNLRPGKAEKLGIGFEQLRRIKPDLIYCYLPGFGSDGPKSHLKSFAPLISGFTGMLYVGAGDGNEPVGRVLGNEDLYNGFSGAMAALMALERRARTGEGEYVESPHLHSSLLVRTEQAADPQGNLVAALSLDRDQTGWSPLYRLYRTSDWWIAIACVGDANFRRLADALGRPTLAADPRFVETHTRAQHAADLAETLSDTFAALTSEAAEAALRSGGVPCAVPDSDPHMPEFLWDEWALQTGRVYEHHHPEHGWIREVGQCVRLARTPAVNRGPSPMLGQHTEELLLEMGFTDVEVGVLTERGVCLRAGGGDL
jgi:crotonobetainyl-CoA:carnitine CoA-transferase CaiB-like acyl-CoA transferase